MRTSKLKCGCEYSLGEREQWVRLCPAHQAEWAETHGRWAAEHAARAPLPEGPKPTEPKRRRK